MYKRVIKPILFVMIPERAHLLVLGVLSIIGRLPFGLSFLRSLYRFDDLSLEREVLGLRFRNPIGMAAGFDRSGRAIDGLGALGFGFVEVGTVTAEAQEGNPKPRLFRLGEDRALVSRLGNPNRGWAYAIEQLRRRRGDVVVGCNIARGNNTPFSAAARDYQKCFRNLYQYVDYFTVNLNYKHLTQDREMTPQEAIEEVLAPLFDFRRGQSDYRPILIKVSPDLSDEMLDAVSDVLISTPLDGVVAVSGTKGREDLKSSEESIAKIGSGRLSGAPLRERALEVVRHIHTRTDGAYPIIGVGGMMSADDVREMMAAGASLVQIYSGLIFEGPSVVGDICRALATGAQERTTDLQGGEFPVSE